MTKENALKAYAHYKEVATDKEKYKMPNRLRQNAINAVKDLKEKIKRSYGIDVDTGKPLTTLVEKDEPVKPINKSKVKK